MPKRRRQRPYQLVTLAAALALIAAGGCAYPPYDGDESALEERHSVWQHLKVYSIYQDRLPNAPNPGLMEPDEMFDCIHDTLHGVRYTDYTGGGYGEPPEFEDPWPLTDSTVYFYLPEFSEEALSVFQDKDNMLTLSSYPNVVIDVRYNGGGRLDVAEKILGELLPDGTPYIKRRYRRYNSRERAGETVEDTGVAAMPRRALFPKKIAVLMNGWSASASEILAAGLKDGAGAYLVGAKSYGKGIGQAIFDRGDGYKGLRITFLELSGLTGRTGQYHRVGLEPDAVPDELAATPDKTARAAYARWKNVTPEVLDRYMQALKPEDRETLRIWYTELFHAVKLMEPAFTPETGGGGGEDEDGEDAEDGDDVVDNGGGVVDKMAKQRVAADKLRNVTTRIHNAKARWRPMGAVVVDEKDLPNIKLSDD